MLLAAHCCYLPGLVGGGDVEFCERSFVCRIVAVRFRCPALSFISFRRLALDAPPSNWSTGFFSAFTRARFYLAHGVPRAYIHSLRIDTVQSDHSHTRDSHYLYDLFISGNARYLSCAILFVVIHCFCSCDNRPLLFVSNTARVIFTFENKRTSS